MICKKCGAHIEDNSTECKFCGASYETAEPIKEEPAEIIPPTEEVPGIVEEKTDTDAMFDENEIKRQRQIEKIKAEKQSQLDEIEKRRREKKAKQRTTRFLVVLLALLCLGGAMAGGYYLFNSDSREPEVVISTATPAEETEAPTEAVEETEAPSELPTESATETAWEAVENDAAVSENNSANNSQTSNKTTNGGGATTGNVAVKATPKPKATSKPSSNASNSATVTKPATSTATMGGTDYIAEGGMVDGNFTAALVTGGEVVKNGDKTYMSFKYNGTMYYAKVSDNTTTNFIAGKAMTLSAYKISETYNGVNVYEITAITHYNGDYVFPNSGFKLLTDADLTGKSAWELRVGRNEIYARHGRKFKDSSLQSYFNGCSWYRVKSSYDYSNDSNNLNAIEKANINLIKKYEAKN